MNTEDIERILDRYYSMDYHYESGRVLGSMYTAVPDIVLKAFLKFYQANLGNPGLYSGTLEMEKFVIKFLLKLTSGKESYYGHILSGGTEANITALWAARNMGYRRVLMTRDAHFSLLKAANILNMPVKYIDMKNGVMDVNVLEKNCKDRDIVVATAGTTSLGYIDPIEEISEICSDKNAYLHVDAAFGGFVIPFLRELGYLDTKFGFDVPSVRSITVDPHKMGLAPYPAGGLVARENIFKHISVPAPYLTSGESETLLGTRQSGSVAAAYAAILYFGWNGYKKMVNECMNNSEYLKKRAEEEGFETEPFVMNIVNLRVSDTEYVKKELFKMGWAVSTNPSYGTLRIVVMPHVKPEIIDSFLIDLKKIVKNL